MQFLSPGPYHNPAVVVAQVKAVEPYGTVNHLIYADGRCSCARYKFTGRCAHANFARQILEDSGGPVALVGGAS